MKQKVPVFIEIDEEDEKKCGKNCLYERSPRQFTTMCYLFMEEINWLGVGRGTIRCQKCIDAVERFNEEDNG